MGAFLISAGKKISTHLIISKSSKNKDIFKTLMIVFSVVIFLTISTFVFICLSPLSILSTLFLGIHFEDVLKIKNEAGYMQEQDIIFIKNKSKEYYYTDEDGNTRVYETDEFSDIFIENGSNCVYFNQADERWANHPYAGSTSYWSACGPTSMSMVISTLTGKNITPPTMMDIATQSGYACDGSGSYHSIVPGLSKQFGLNCQAIGNDANKLKKALESGYLVVALMGKGDFTSNGHFIVLRGITADGKVLVNDPSSNRRTNMSWDFDKFPKQSIKWAGNGGPFWIITK